MRKLVCIVCPRGCNLEINDNLEVSGNYCKRGKDFAINEITAPKRMLSSTVKINSKLINMLPVKTSGEVLKEKIFLILEELKKIKLNPPIYFNEVIIKNILNLGVDIVSTREILE